MTTKHALVIRAAIGAVGVALWGYGYRYDVSAYRLAGIACLAVALLLKFVLRTAPPERNR